MNVLHDLDSLRAPVGLGIRNPRLAAVIRCPECHERFESIPEALLRCLRCRRSYRVDSGVPVLFHPDSEFAQIDPVRPTTGSVPSKLSRFSLSNLRLTRWLNDRFFESINQCADDDLILNLGSGVGLFDDKLRRGLTFINLDIYTGATTDLLADGHYLPFADGSFDAVASNAVLEHVRKPWIIADEIWRVLKPGGKVFINVPFLNVIHDERDYYRYTDRGLEALFDRFERIEVGVSSGPLSFAGTFLVEYMACFVPDGILRRIVRQPLILLAWPLKYFDVLIRKSGHIRVTADAFYYIGRKPNS